MIPQEYAAWANASFPWEDATCTCQSCRRKLVNPSVERAAEASGTFLAVVRQPSRSKALVNVRQAFWFNLTIVEGLSYPQAGRRTGHDHSTVIYGVRQYAMRTLGTREQARREEIEAAWLAVGTEKAA